MVELDLGCKSISHIAFTKDDCEIWACGSIITGFNKEEIAQIKKWLKWEANHIESCKPYSYVEYMIRYGQFEEEE